MPWHDGIDGFLATHCLFLLGEGAAQCFCLVLRTSGLVQGWWVASRCVCCPRALRRRGLTVRSADLAFACCRCS